MAASKFCSPKRALAPQQGFTLLEVLVALAVVAIALGALMSAAGAQTRNSADLQARTFAHWVALNQAAELDLHRGPLRPGHRSGSEAMAGRTWFWDIDIAATADPDVRRATIEVRGERDAPTPAARLVAHVFVEADN